MLDADNMHSVICGKLDMSEEESIPVERERVFPFSEEQVERLKEDICSQMREEMHFGFDKLALTLSKEIEQAFDKKAKRSIGTLGTIAAQRASGRFRPSFTPQKMGNLWLHSSTFDRASRVSDDSPEANAISSMNNNTGHHRKKMQPWREAVVSEIHSHERKIQTYLIDMIQEIRVRNLEGENLDTRLHSWVQGKVFTLLSFFIIMANAAWMGYECNVDLDKQEGYIQNVNLVFTTWFIIELLLRILALRRYFIFGEDWAWNFLDFVLVLTSIPEYFQNSMKVSFLRIVRMVKLSRAFRLVRLVKFVTSLREILLSLFFTLGSLFWSFISLVLVSYIFALLFMQSISLKRQEGSAEFEANTLDNFKSTWTAMLALFSMISGGQDWFVLVQDFNDQGDYMSKYALVFYIFFMEFGLVNVIIGVFCAKATDASSADDQLRVHREEEKRQKKVRDLIYIFNEIDSQHTGSIHWDRFKEFFESKRAQSMLQFHGLQLFDVNKLWQVMDAYDGAEDGWVDLPGFVMGVMRLAGNAKSTELVMLTVQVEELNQAMQHVVKALVDSIDGGHLPRAEFADHRSSHDHLSL